MEKNPTTIRLAKMNLAVHGLEGDISKAISYYDDPHKDKGPFDFVMANPPFNVDEIDAEKIKNDDRLEFGLPGVNKGGKVSNGNYVWMSFFHAYLSDTGRAGIVMSSQCSSAGGGEAKVREAMIKTGDIDVMIAIRSNFFYTRSVPCELWFFDKAKPQHFKDKVLMIDARNVYRKVTRKIYDFTPEQQQNLSSIVWLYRGQADRFLDLAQGYLETAFTQMQACDFDGFEQVLKAVTRAHKDEELMKLATTVTADIAALSASATNVRTAHWDNTARDNDGLKASSAAFEPVADQAKALVKEIDHLYKLATRVHEADVADGTKPAEGKKRLNKLDKAREEVTEHLKGARYFHSQAVWLQTRFPDAELCDVEGLVKLVGQVEMETNDWSLTPGRYVGVAPDEEDEDFDFEEALRDIHIEIEGLNTEAAELAETIKKNFGGLIV